MADDNNNSPFADDPVPDPDNEDKEPYEEAP